MSGHEGLERFRTTIKELAKDLEVDLPSELISIVRGMDPAKFFELNLRMVCGHGPELHSSPHAHHICGIIGGHLVVPARIADVVHKHLGDPATPVAHREGMWRAIHPVHWFVDLLEGAEADVPEIYEEGLLLTA